MAINIVEILGTDSISQSRITLNNNFSEIKDKVDPILDTYDTQNGVLNISDLPNGQIIAKRMTVTTAGINVQGGAVTIGSTSNVVMNGGQLQLSTGLATLGGGLVVGGSGIELTNTKSIREDGDFDFLGNIVSDTNLRRTYYIGASGADNITLEILTRTTEIVLINDRGTSISLNAQAGEIGNDLTATGISVPDNTAIMLKFVIPGGANPSDGQWWVIQGNTVSFTT